MKTPEQYRIKDGVMATSESDGNNGCFVADSILGGRELGIIASDGMGWEHVSISVRQGSSSRTPNWVEMCQVKDLFWDNEDCVIQYHPPKSEYVNNHPDVLHLWKPVGKQIETPPSILVGIK
ncbi:MAG TPA: hypothetical protein ENI63_00790 [Candidatus Kaiserbacteria bacterium]|nr:hypothetical protein [Candidatus Kaiserbacteria bacterium]